MLSRQQILSRVKALELKARKNVSSLLAGNYRTAIKGSGMVFKEARKYVIGESIRQIDWNITARMREPYVKEVEEDRQREIYVLIDISPSMLVGWQELTKFEYALELAATIFVAALENKEKFGYVLFSNQVYGASKPLTGRSHLMQSLDHCISALNMNQGQVDVSDPRLAIHQMQLSRKGKYVVFLISDFIDKDIPDDLNYLGNRHDVNLFHIYDSLEYTYSNDVRFLAQSAEGESSISTLRFGATGALSAMTDYLKSEANKHRMFFHSFNTQLHAGKELTAFFHQKQRRLIR